ncbi:MAG: adenosine deaminase [Alphaproteobacteria bacterium]|nr:adenosine deaminase [Alphaproteobacteria bacterium]MBU0798467.1 adenosine deaminase [Alphaproteobacteria bacterium]MBU0888425.1 adenosine deaminase [Alphaproteobacteria bacterium]MBU1814736.1 adenosine deaminase [Alphaproteobacteria bacterium]
MLMDDDPETVEGFVTLAKALFYNLTLLRAFEKACPDRPRRSSPKSYLSRCLEDRKAITKAHREGLFLQMRRQMPHLTDEALENRLILINERFRVAVRQVRVKHARRPPHQPDRTDDADSVLTGLLSHLPDLLEVLAETFLREAPDGSLRVRSRLIAHWQDLILVVPPLLISSAWIHRRILPQPEALDDYSNRVDAIRRMTRWLCDSTLPVDDDPTLDHLCRQHGLDEIHMHLMGTTEAEKIWCDALRRPQIVVGELIKGRSKTRESGLRLSIGSGVDRLLRQEDSQLTADLLLARVNEAATLKALLLFHARGASEQELTDDMPMPSDFCTQERRRGLHALPSNLPLVVKESWHLCRILALFDKPEKRASTWRVLWHYLLLRAQFCRLLVQQVGQIGFDQFQYITLNELRETSEADFAERFRQIERGHQRGVDFAEGRFAPKAEREKMVGLLGSILRGYIRFLDEDEQGEARPRKRAARYGSLSELVSLARRRETGETVPGVDAAIPGHRASMRWDMPPVSGRRLRLGLVVHFIKRNNHREQKTFVTAVSPRPPCRHLNMRRDAEKQARTLVAFLGEVSDLSHFIRGADAAANERHAGPEVLAPVFRILRRAGIQRFTYHAGEDFAHLASGLRAMFEAVSFLDLDAGCRIGHGTASGLSPEAWWAAIGNSTVLPTEDRLDDLVFARHLLLSNALLPERLALIDAEINRLSMLIYNDPYLTPDLLTEAWQLRHLDPLAWRFRGDDIDPHRRAEALLHAEAKRETRAAHRHFLRRHGVHSVDTMFTLRQMRDEAARGAAQMPVARGSDILDIDTLRMLQRCMLRILNQRRMAIETLPSSNVRISIHKRYEDHHSLNWLGLGAGSLRMPVDVVVGSDDPGIFATSLRMEYAQLMRCLRDECRNSNDPFDPFQKIEKICLDAKRFRF